MSTNRRQPAPRPAARGPKRPTRRERAGRLLGRLLARAFGLLAVVATGFAAYRYLPHSSPLWGSVRPHAEPAAAAAPSTRQQPREAGAFKPVLPAPIELTLVGRRIVPPPGEAGKGRFEGVPAYSEREQASDLKTFKLYLPADRAQVGYLYQARSRATRPIKAVVGLAVVRDATGRALAAAVVHFPRAFYKVLHPKIPPGFTFHGLVKAEDQEPEDHEPFARALAAPLAGTRLTFETSFVAYWDGTVAGDAKALLLRPVRVPDVRVQRVYNFVPWILKMQYPDEYPGATENTIFVGGGGPRASLTS